MQSQKTQIKGNLHKEINPNWYLSLVEYMHVCRYAETVEPSGPHTPQQDPPIGIMPNSHPWKLSWNWHMYLGVWFMICWNRSLSNLRNHHGSYAIDIKALSHLIHSNLSKSWAMDNSSIVDEQAKTSAIQNLTYFLHNSWNGTEVSDIWKKSTEFEAILSSQWGDSMKEPRLPNLKMDRDEWALASSCKSWKIQDVSGIELGKKLR